MNVEDDFYMPEEAYANSAGRTAKYPLVSLEVGQGFKVEADNAKYRSIASAVSRFRRDNPTKTIQLGHLSGIAYIKRTA